MREKKSVARREHQPLSPRCSPLNYGIFKSRCGCGFGEIGARLCGTHGLGRAGLTMLALVWLFCDSVGFLLALHGDVALFAWIGLCSIAESGL